MKRTRINWGDKEIDHLKYLSVRGLTYKEIALALNKTYPSVVSKSKELNLNMQIVNPQGGAIALGHPLGATGAIRAATIIHGLRRTQQKYGMVTMCVGTGMGAAGIFERV